MDFLLQIPYVAEGTDMFGSDIATVRSLSISSVVHSSSSAAIVAS